MRKATTNKLPVFTVKGSPYEMGNMHGKKAQSEIRHNLDVYFKRFKNETELSRDQVLERSAKYLRAISKTSPEYAQAMRGVADGSDSDLLDITAINVRYELMYSQFAKIGVKPIPRTFGCTAFAALPTVMKNRHLLMGQNWDWIPQVKGLFLKVRNERAPDILCFTEAGVVGGKIGLNSEGLGLLINGIVSNRDDWSFLRKPFHVRCWEILRARTLQEAVKVVTRVKRNCSANFLLGQHKASRIAKVVDIESAPDATCEFTPDKGAIAHTNHFLNPESLGVEQVVDEERQSTLHRYRRMNTLLDASARRGKLSLGQAQSMLRDHDGKPESVCRHPNPTLPEDDRYETVVSVIMDLYTRKLWATMGNPCTGQYLPVRL